MTTNALKAIPITDLYEDDDEKESKGEAYSPYNDETFLPEQQVLIRVIEEAVRDCQSVFQKPGDRALKEADIILAISACRFLLSDTCKAYILLAGGAEDMLDAAKKLAFRTLELFGLSPKDVFRNSHEAWEKSVENGKWPRNFEHSKVIKKTQQGVLRLFLDTDKWVGTRQRKRLKRPKEIHHSKKVA